MVKWAAAGFVVLLLAAAFFLPEWLSSVNDAQLLNTPVIQTHSEDQEGFAESTQLTVAEKLLLMRSGSLSAMELSQEKVSGVFINISGSEEPEIDYHAGDAVDYETELTRRWEQRLEAVKQEIRSLQAVGGLPQMWSADSDLSYAGYGELLYVDADARINFQVYRMGLKSEAYSMDVTVDMQSGRILAFSIRWDWGTAPNWGMRGAVNFGGVWRKYWEMDSVGSGWYNENNKDVLEHASNLLKQNGDYYAVGQISFQYDGQPVGIPMECAIFGGRSAMFSWNC